MKFNTISYDKFNQSLRIVTIIGHAIDLESIKIIAADLPFNIVILIISTSHNPKGLHGLLQE
jgi:hypothetical protein